MRQLAVLALVIFTGTCVLSQTKNSKKVCTYSKDEGNETCSNSTEIRWYFNGTSCQPFMFKGCGGNENNFGRQDDCQRLCEPQTHVHFDPPKLICLEVKDYWILNKIMKKNLSGILPQSEEDDVGSEERDYD
uniref:Putative secreted protease inhibitor n=1 Tax=Amblyomma cajennense TaxID=34607 RepID=A0A023FSU5_AMBCJ